MTRLRDVNGCIQKYWASGWTRLRFIAAAALMFYLLRGVCAQVDQDHWVPNNFNNQFNSFLGLQQEFTPTLGAMDNAQLSIAQDPGDGLYIYPGSVALDIRQGGIGGPVIAESAPIALPAYFRGDIVFRFSPTLNLAPGQIYAMEP